MTYQAGRDGDTNSSHVVIDTRTNLPIRDPDRDAGRGGHMNFLAESDAVWYANQLNAGRTQAELRWPDKRADSKTEGGAR